MKKGKTNVLSYRIKTIIKRLKYKLRRHWKKSIPYIIFGYFGNKAVYAFRMTTDKNFWMRLVKSVGNLEKAFDNPLPSFNGYDLLGGVATGFIIWFIVYYKRKNARKFRTGYEYGSAKWSNADTIEPYRDSENPDNNIILTNTECIRLTGHCISNKYDVNKNVVVIGGSGSGKTRFYLKPNLMQLSSTYIVTDPKGQVLIETGEMFRRAGYKIKTFNTIDFSQSMHYNPMAYIRSELDILCFVDILMENTRKENASSGDPFWEDAEKLLYMAYIGFIHYECIEEEQNFGTLLDMINASETREDDEDFKNAIDLIFEDLEKEQPDHFALLQYRKLKLAAGKTMKSILISCAARLAPFEISGLREITEYDELDLDMLAERKSILFMIMSDTKKTYHFLMAILEAQIMNMLCDMAFKMKKGKLRVHVRLLLDEFANIGKIPNFEQMIAVIRSREISASIILQSKAQLKALYKDHAQTIIANCDSELFLGGRDPDTLKDLSQLLGKETVDMQNASDTKGASPSTSVSYQKIGKELMTPDEIAVMEGSKCILQIRGARPFLSEKYDITRHKRFVQLEDYKDENAFDVKKYLSTTLRLKKKQIVEVHDMGVIEE